VRGGGGGGGAGGAGGAPPELEVVAYDEVGALAAALGRCACAAGARGGGGGGGGGSAAEGAAAAAAGAPPERRVLRFAWAGPPAAGEAVVALWAAALSLAAVGALPPEAVAPLAAGAGGGAGGGAGAAAGASPPAPAPPAPDAAAPRLAPPPDSARAFARGPLGAYLPPGAPPGASPGGGGGGAPPGGPWGGDGRSLPARAARRVLVLINPAAGPGRARAMYERLAARVLADAGVAADARELGGPGAAGALLAGLPPAELYAYAGVLVAGGDGTLNEAVGGLLARPDWAAAARRVALGVLPAGSGNGLAHSLAAAAGLPATPLTAALLVAKGAVSRMDVCSVFVAAERPAPGAPGAPPELAPRGRGASGGGGGGGATQSRSRCAAAWAAQPATSSASYSDMAPASSTTLSLTSVASGGRPPRPW